MVDDFDLDKFAAGQVLEYPIECASISPYISGMSHIYHKMKFAQEVAVKGFMGALQVREIEHLEELHLCKGYDQTNDTVMVQISAVQENSN